MVRNLVNIISNVFAPLQSTEIRPISTSQQSSNPFGNPFLTKSTYQFYGKNQPVKGGYFAGYYNGKQNIVGSRLFIEV